MTHYELRVDGHLDRRWSTWFGGLALRHDREGTTTLRGKVIDQAALHGHLARIRDLGATLISVTRIDARERSPRAGEPDGRRCS